MTTLELLRQRAGELARQIDTAGEERLSRICSAIAHAAVERSGLSHPVIIEALQLLSVSARPQPELRGRVQTLAKQLDEDYFRLQELCETGEATEAEVLSAFAQARAATAVAAALGDVVRTAAAETAYEAIAATDDSTYFTGIARSVLTM